MKAKKWLSLLMAMVMMLSAFGGISAEASETGTSETGISETGTVEPGASEGSEESTGSEYRYIFRIGDQESVVVGAYEQLGSNIYVCKPDGDFTTTSIKDVQIIDQQDKDGNPATTSIAEVSESTGGYWLKTFAEGSIVLQYTLNDPESEVYGETLTKEATVYVDPMAHRIIVPTGYTLLNDAKTYTPHVTRGGEKIEDYTLTVDHYEDSRYQVEVTADKKALVVTTLSQGPSSPILVKATTTYEGKAYEYSTYFTPWVKDEYYEIENALEDQVVWVEIDDQIDLNDYIDLYHYHVVDGVNEKTLATDYEIVTWTVGDSSAYEKIASDGPLPVIKVIESFGGSVYIQAQIDSDTVDPNYCNADIGYNVFSYELSWMYSDSELYDTETLDLGLDTTWFAGGDGCTVDVVIEEYVEGVKTPVTGMDLYELLYTEEKLTGIRLNGAAISAAAVNDVSNLDLSVSVVVSKNGVEKYTLYPATITLRKTEVLYSYPQSRDILPNNGISIGETIFAMVRDAANPDGFSTMASVLTAFEML